jgi:hypothetical protein
MPVDYFDVIYERLLKEIETLMMTAKNVMALPTSHKHSNQGNLKTISLLSITTCGMCVDVD